MLWLRLEHWEQMRDHAARTAPEEACGLVGGQHARSQVVLPVENSLHSPVRFRMDPQQQLDAFLQIEAQGLVLLAIYHSHPTGPDHPSPTDIAEAAYPEAITLIWSPQPGGWECQAFQILDGRVRPVQIQVEPS